MRRIIFLDLETRKHAEDLRPDDKDAGWDELRSGKGGASAIAIYDAYDMWLYLYDDLSLGGAVKRLEQADAVIGFCSSRFDIPVIEGLLGRALRLRTHYDIYTEISKANAEKGIRPTIGDLKLDTISRRNLGRGKINHGSHAKELARQGRYGELFNYCGDDVHLTYDLFVKICTNGGLINHTGKFIALSVPEWLRNDFSEE